MQRHTSQLEHSGRSRTRRIASAGYTLIELIIAIVASSFLLIGMASSIFIATKIVDPGQRTQQILDASQVVGRITDELRCAKSILERSATAVEFVVDDRTGDGQSDRIRYEWSGVAGDPLTKILNDSNAETVLQSVQDFDLNYLIETKTEQIESPPTESSEMLLTEYMGASQLEDFRITTTDWIGQFTEPSIFNVNNLPTDTMTWTVTKADIRAKYTNSGGNGEAWVRVRSATGGNKPSTTVIDEAVLYESSLSSNYTTKSLVFPNEIPLAPTDSICLTVEHKDNAYAADIQYDEYDDDWRVVTQDGGATWFHPPYHDSMRHRIYGKYIQPSYTNETITRNYLEAVALTVQVGDQDTAVTTEATVFNRPELCSAFWETKFDSDPTAQDLDFDGTNDFRTRDSSTFTTGSLVNGVFEAYGVALDTAPDHDFDKTTTVEARMKNTSIGGAGAICWINADWSGSNAAPIYTNLKLQSDDTQTLSVFWKESSSVANEVATVEGLSNDFINIRIVVEPTTNIFAVWADEQFVGSFDYIPFNINSGHRWATVHESGSDAEFESFRVKVAE